MTPRIVSQRGAALITVLMIVAAMSVAALAITKAVTDAAQRARALDAQAQLAFYAVAAEDVAKARMADLLAPLEYKLFAELPGLGEPQIIPVNGGAFSVSARDATNCFDVNTLTKFDGESGQVGDPEARAAYQALLTASLDSGLASDMQALVSSVTDWMDENSVPGNGGAEDSYYLSETPSYRTSGQKLAGLDELRAIRGYSPEIMAQIQPLLCALPARFDAQPMALNINTLDAWHAPLLQAVFSDALSLDDAQTLIATRPLGGWVDTESFLADPLVQRIDPAQIKTEQISLVTRLVEVSANVSYRGYDMTMRYLFEVVPGQPIRTLNRERIG
jgi:general secretion pathway protein K